MFRILRTNRQHLIENLYIKFISYYLIDQLKYNFSLNTKLPIQPRLLLEHFSNLTVIPKASSGENVFDQNKQQLV